MKVESTFIPDVKIISPNVFGDDRGYFFESYNQDKYRDSGLNVIFVQDNISKSKMGTLRGLHYQVGKNAQGKLCQVLYGEVLDIAVDIRIGSPTFGDHVSQILSEENKIQIWLPPGFAHGFSVLSDEAIFSYKCTAPYNREDERCILYNDPDLNIDWKVISPIISDKDRLGKKFKDIERDFEY